METEVIGLEAGARERLAVSALGQWLAPLIAVFDAVIPGEPVLIASPAEEHRFPVHLRGKVDEPDGKAPVLEVAPHVRKLPQILFRLFLKAQKSLVIIR